MPNTGLLQATIAYKVSKPGGEPVDINGALVSVSGGKQAIALLLGTANPNPLLYDVEYYFNERGVISGNNTVQYSDACPFGYIFVFPEYDAPVAIFEETTLPTPTWLDQPWNAGATAANIWLDTRCTLLANSTFLSVAVHARTAGNIKIHFILIDGLTVTQSDTFAAVLGVNVFTPTFTDVRPHYVAVEGITGTVGIISPASGNVYGKRFNGTALVNSLYNFAYTIDVEGVANNIRPVQLSSSHPWTIYDKSDFIITDVSSGPAGISNVSATVLELDTEGFITFLNPTTGQTITYQVLLASNGDWVLETGAWRMAGFWYDTEIFNF